MRILAVMLLSSLCSNSAFSFSAAELFTYCRLAISERPAGRTDIALMEGICLGTVSAIPHAIEFFARERNVKPSICLPARVTRQQLALITLKYIDENPQTHHLPAEVAATRAIAAAFPCKD
ncbi:MAG: hypothetical protein ABS54_14355 [Hyphomicrobium sp. SCN 65-11]|nr:MAG: hypothetical protein ABS54_14355 [Hyphomicrobium sp. SCN 65-11]